MKRRNFLLLIAAACFSTLLGTGAPALADQQEVLMTGGTTGDYYLNFGPPIVKLLEKAWVDAPLRESKGTPDNMDWLVLHPLSYALLQGNVYAELIKNDKYAGKIKILRGNGIGNETVLAVMSDKLFTRSQGSWGAVAAHAKQVRIVTSSEASGPGQTLRQLQALDPTGLGLAEPKFLDSVDAAINAVADGQADVAVIVQFANPQNPRFKLIADKGLKIAPVLSASMKGLEIPGVGPAFTLCENVQVTAKTVINTACTPILVATGATNENADLKRVFASVTEADFTPHEPTFAKLWKSVLSKGGAAWDAAVSKASELAAKANL